MASRTERRNVWVGALAIVSTIAILVAIRTYRRTPGAVEYVVIISLDGLSSDAVRTLGQEQLPVIYGLAKRGASTWNARADPRSTETLANHLSMMTGQTVSAHGYTDNTMEKRTPASIRCDGLFDVLARHRHRAALVSSKEKFILYGERWADELDRVDVADRSDVETFAAWKAIVDARHPSLSFLHFAGVDRAGHKHGWKLDPDAPYVRAVKDLESVLAGVIDVIDRDREMANKTAIIVTSDHGGREHNHVEPNDPANYTVPLIVVVPAARGGTDLYSLNTGARADPGTARTSSIAVFPPITSAEIANAALALLGLPSVPNSTANVRQDMYFGEPREKPR